MLLGIMSLCTAWGGRITVDGVRISYNLGATLPTNPHATTDLCGKMISKNSSLYHLEVNGVTSNIQKWAEPIGGSALTPADTHTYPGALFDFGTDYNSPEFVVVESGTNLLKAYSDLNGNNYKTVSYSGADVPMGLHMANNRSYFYY